MTGEHPGCRRAEFSRWTRVMLDHEREFISGVMASAYTPPWERDLLLRDLADIDACLAALDEPLKVRVPQ